MVSTKLLIVSMVDLSFGLFLLSLPNRFCRPEDWLYANTNKAKQQTA